jgi:predicted transcriptional regulator
MDPIPDELWQKTTWEGARREYVRRALELTVRERLQALDEMIELAERFAEMRAEG